MQFARGRHDAGVDTSDRAKLDAIVMYALDGDERELEVFDQTDRPSAVLDVLSNVSWLVWIVIAALLFFGGRYAFKLNRAAGVAYAVLMLGLLTSV